MEGLAIDLDCRPVSTHYLHHIVVVVSFDSEKSRTKALAVLCNGNSGGGPLLAEASNALGGRRHGREGLCCSRGWRDRNRSAFALESLIVVFRESFADAAGNFLDRGFVPFDVWCGGFIGWDGQKVELR